MSPYSNAPFTIRKQKRSRGPRIILFIILLLCIIALWYVFRGVINKTRHTIPVLYPDVTELMFLSKRKLVSRVTDLQTELEGHKAQLEELEALKMENQSLKTELGRLTDEKGILAHVLTAPNRSFYNSINIDAGANQGIHIGATVFAFDNIALGTVSSVDTNSAVVELFSAPGRETTGSMLENDVAVTLIGRSGGEYEIRMPRDIKFSIGSLVMFQSVHTAVLAKIEKVVTDPRDPFQRLYGKAPINLQALKWVIVK
jgi:cell shape-determining protein MreC